MASWERHVPEALLANREQVLLRYLFRNGAYDKTTFSDDEINTYVQSFAALGGVRGALSHIRAIPQSAAYNRKHSERKLSMPVLAIGGSKSFGQSMAEVAGQFAADITGAVPERCAHWIPEERPAWLLSKIITFCADDLIMKPTSHVESPSVKQASSATRVQLNPGDLGATYFIVTAIVPPLLVTHALVFRVLTSLGITKTPAGIFRSVAKWC